MGALLSGLMGAVCLGFAKTRLWKHNKAYSLDEAVADAAAPINPVEIVDELPDEQLDDPDNVTNIVAASLERSMMATRNVVLMRERKAILNKTLAGGLSHTSGDSSSTRELKGSASMEAALYPRRLAFERSRTSFIDTSPTDPSSKFGDLNSAGKHTWLKRLSDGDLMSRVTGGGFA